MLRIIEKDTGDMVAVNPLRVGHVDPNRNGTARVYVDRGSVTVCFDTKAKFEEVVRLINHGPEQR